MSQSFVVNFNGECPYILSPSFVFSAPGLAEGYCFVKKGIRVEVFLVEDGKSKDIPDYTIDNSSNLPLMDIVSKFWKEKTG